MTTQGETKKLRKGRRMKVMSKEEKLMGVIHEQKWKLMIKKGDEGEDIGKGRERENEMHKKELRMLVAVKNNK